MIATLLLVAVTAPAWGQAPMPRLVDIAGTRQLEVDGKPFLLLGGELANSSASSRAYMASRWKPLAEMNLNTVLMPVSWELIEPSEGRFDFTLVDGLLADARAAGLRVVVLWFGSWKNSMSSYAPGWVKRDERRFPRARLANGAPLELLSPFAAANAEADARAFAALMRHLARTDTARTVIMAQVENEVGMVSEARDRSAAAASAWAAPVPAALGRRGSWSLAYGEIAEEAFMAWHFARYVERVAAAGKREHPLPMFVNAALPRPGTKPGVSYPGSGPLPHLFDIWRTGAPSIDLLAPDIYFPNFVEWAARYASSANPLLIPEAGHAGSSDVTANALFAFGALHAIGFSPFSIDTMPVAAGRDLAQLYALLRELTPLILARRGGERLWGARPPIAYDGTADTADRSVTMDGHRLTMRFVDPWTAAEKQVPANHGGIVIGLGDDEYLVAGRGVTLTFAPADGQGLSGIEAIDDGHVANGRFVAHRRLNGDESHQGRHLRVTPDRFAVQRVKLYRYR